MLICSKIVLQKISFEYCQVGIQNSPQHNTIYFFVYRSEVPNIVIVLTHKSYSYTNTRHTILFKSHRKAHHIETTETPNVTLIYIIRI